EEQISPLQDEERITLHPYGVKEGQPSARNLVRAETRASAVGDHRPGRDGTGAARSRNASRARSTASCLVACIVTGMFFNRLITNSLTDRMSALLAWTTAQCMPTSRALLSTSSM